jgi:hypothetical protein
MNHENTNTERRWLTDTDRDNALRLLGCGLSVKEIAPIMKLSKSSIQYIKQAHTACIEKDWSTLQRMSTTCRPTVDWAMRVTGTDKVFLETFPKEEEPVEETKEPEVTPTPENITREDFLSMYATMSDIRNLLIEIRDILK